MLRHAVTLTIKYSSALDDSQYDLVHTFHFRGQHRGASDNGTRDFLVVGLGRRRTSLFHGRLMYPACLNGAAIRSVEPLR
jgi:hypothetical protein